MMQDVIPLFSFINRVRQDDQALLASENMT